VSKWENKVDENLKHYTRHNNFLQPTKAIYRQLVSCLFVFCLWNIYVNWNKNQKQKN